IWPADAGRLTYDVKHGGRSVIEPSGLGIVVDGVNLGQDVSIGRVERYTTNEPHPTLGVHSTAVDKSVGARIAVTHRPSKTAYEIDVRVFDDAAAFQTIVPGTGRRVPDAADVFRLPAGSIVWSHDLVGHYEGVYARKPIEEVKDGEWAGPPVAIRLPNGAGYAAITEAGLTNYAGMVLQGDGKSGFRERLGHAAP